MSNLKDRYQSGDALTHLQVHNVWPILGMLISIGVFLFTSGQIYNKFISMQDDYYNYKTSIDGSLREMRKSDDEMNKLYVDMDKRVSRIEDRLPAVKGVSTKSSSTSAELKISPTVGR